MYISNLKGDNLKNTQFILLFFLIQTLFTFPVFAGAQKEEGGTLNLIATTSIIYDVVSHVAGDSAVLKDLMKPGQDPHSYQPTPRDMAAVEKADIVFVNGFGLEEGLLETLESVNKSAIFEVSQGIKALKMVDNNEEELEGEHHHEGSDPHTWTSPLNVLIWVENIRDALVAADPVNSESYKINAKAYTVDLMLLHEELIDQIKSVPENRRVMVTDHGSFGYMANVYGFRVAGTIIKGFSSNAESSSKDLTDLIKTINEENVSAFFIGESSSDDLRKLSEALNQELKKPVRIIALLSGSLHEKGSDADSYISYMRYNMSRIVSGLTE